MPNKEDVEISQRENSKKVSFRVDRAQVVLFVVD